MTDHPLHEVDICGGIRIAKAVRTRLGDRCGFTLRAGGRRGGGSIRGGTAGRAHCRNNQETESAGNACHGNAFEELSVESMSSRKPTLEYTGGDARGRRRQPECSATCRGEERALGASFDARAALVFVAAAMLLFVQANELEEVRERQRPEKHAGDAEQPDAREGTDQ